LEESSLELVTSIYTRNPSSGLADSYWC